MTLPCDGCRAPVESADLHLIAADNNQARYCEPCREVYQKFLAASLVVEERYNRLLDLELQTIRSRVSLLLVPQDLPRRARALEGLVLG